MHSSQKSASKLPVGVYGSTRNIILSFRIVLSFYQNCTIRSNGDEETIILRVRVKLSTDACAMLMVAKAIFSNFAFANTRAQTMEFDFRCVHRQDRMQISFV